MRTRFFGAAGAGSLLAATLLLASPSGAGLPPLEMVLTPTEVEAGTPVVAEPAPENECPGTKGEVELQFRVSDSADALVDDGVAPVNEFGDWQVEIDTAGLEVGEYSVEADCVIVRSSPGFGAGRSAGGDLVYQSYSPEIFEVVAGEGPPPTFDVTSDKASGPAGTTVQLTGIECQPGLGSFVAVKFMPAGPVPEFDNTDETLEVYEVSGGGASFTGPFVVPAGTAPGTYQFVAWCLGEGGQVLDGTEAQVLGFTVTAAAAPTPAAPDFTG